MPVPDLDLDASPPIGFIGLGVMGRSMAARLLAAGFYLRVHTRTATKAEVLMAAGARWEPDPAAQALFAAMGTRIVHQGEAGSGQRVKLCNQIAVFGNTLGTCEALAFAVRSGLDAAKVLDSIGGGAAFSWALANLGPRILNGD